MPEVEEWDASFKLPEQVGAAEAVGWCGVCGGMGCVEMVWHQGRQQLYRRWRSGLQASSCLSRRALVVFLLLLGL